MSARHPLSRARRRPDWSIGGEVGPVVGALSSTEIVWGFYRTRPRRSCRRSGSCDRRRAGERERTRVLLRARVRVGAVERVARRAEAAAAVGRGQSETDTGPLTKSAGQAAPSQAIAVSGSPSLALMVVMAELERLPSASVIDRLELVLAERERVGRDRDVVGRARRVRGREPVAVDQQLDVTSHPSRRRRRSTVTVVA